MHDVRCLETMLNNKGHKCKFMTVIVTMPSDGHCRFPDCKQSGLFFKRLDRHLKRCHPRKTREDNFNCPAQDPVTRSVVKNTDRPRKPCTVLGCRFYEVPISRLERHLKKVHGVTKVNLQERKESATELCFSDEEEEIQDGISAKIAAIVSNL